MINLYYIKNKMLQTINFFKNEVVFTLALSLAIITSFFSMPKVEYIDFKVLITLFNLMIIIGAFSQMKILDKIAVNLLTKFNSYKKISLILIYLTFFSSMLITNDVSLITFIPLTLIISKRAHINPMKLVIFQTLAANIGCGLTPMGSPQNLFIFSFYKLDASQFFRIMLPFTIFGILWLFILNILEKNKEFNFNLEDIIIENRTHVIIFCVLFIFILLSVFNIVNYKIALIITILVVLILNKTLLAKVDYILLLTFVCFFIFTGNLSSFPFIESFAKAFLHNKTTTYFSSILLSQFISNVPCSMLLANFTSNWKELLLGVNIGGLGTLIASLASVISYKLYMNDRTSKKQNTYIIWFTFYNVISLIAFTLINYFIFIF